MSTKRTPRTAAPAAKPTTGKEAFEAGQRAYEEAASGEQAPQPKPTEKPKTRSRHELLAILSRCIWRASNEEISFMQDFAEEWRKGVYTAEEAALSYSLARFGVHDFSCPEDFKRYAADIDRFTLTLNFGDEWLVSLLRVILEHIDLPHRKLVESPIKTPEDLFYWVHDAWNEFQAGVEVARQTLNSHPQALASEIREAAEKLDVRAEIEAA
jgi:hypothetical protein